MSEYTVLGSFEFGIYLIILYDYGTDANCSYRYGAHILEEDNDAPEDDKYVSLRGKTYWNEPVNGVTGNVLSSVINEAVNLCYHYADNKSELPPDGRADYFNLPTIGDI